MRDHDEFLRNATRHQPVRVVFAHEIAIAGTYLGKGCPPAKAENGIGVALPQIDMTR